MSLTDWLTFFAALFGFAFGWIIADVLTRVYDARQSGAVDGGA